MQYAKGFLIDDSLVDAQEAARAATRKALGDYEIPEGELSLVSHRVGDQCVFELCVAQEGQTSPLTIAVASVDAKTLVATVEIQNLKIREMQSKGKVASRPNPSFKRTPDGAA